MSTPAGGIEIKPPSVTVPTVSVNAPAVSAPGATVSAPTVSAPSATVQPPAAPGVTVAAPTITVPTVPAPSVQPPAAPGVTVNAPAVNIKAPAPVPPPPSVIPPSANAKMPTVTIGAPTPKVSLTTPVPVVSVNTKSPYYPAVDVKTPTFTTPKPYVSTNIMSTQPPRPDGDCEDVCCWECGRKPGDPMDHTAMYHLNEREFDDWCFGKITIEPAIYEYQPLFRMIAAINILFGAVTMGCGGYTYAMRAYPIIPVGAWWAGLAVIVASMVSMVGLSKIWVITSAVFNSIGGSVAIAGAVVDGLGTLYTKREENFHLYNLTCVTVAMCCCMVCISTVQVAFNVIAVYKAEEDEAAANGAAEQTKQFGVSTPAVNTPKF